MQSRSVSYTHQAIRRYSKCLWKDGLCKMFKNPDKGKKLLWSQVIWVRGFFKLLKMQYSLEKMSNVTNETTRVEAEHANKIAPRPLSNCEVAWRKHLYYKFMGHLEINFNHELIEGKSRRPFKMNLCLNHVPLVKSYSQ